MENQRSADQLVVRWMWLNLPHLDIVNDEGLADLVHYFAPGYKLPSRKFGTSQLKRSFATAVDKMKELLKVEGACGLSLTSEDPKHGRPL